MEDKKGQETRPRWVDIASESERLCQLLRDATSDWQDIGDSAARLRDLLSAGGLWTDRLLGIS